MKISVTYGEALAQATPLLALGVWEGESLPGAIAGLIDNRVVPKNDPSPKLVDH